MRNGRQVLWGILAALLSSVLLLGGFAAAFVESGSPLALASTPTSTPLPETPTLPVVLPTRVTLAPGVPIPTATPTIPPSPTATIPPPTNCPPLPGWQAITLTGDETLSALAEAYQTTPAEIQAGNCMGQATTLLLGMVIYVPPLPPTATGTASATFTPAPPPVARPTSTSIPCGPPPGWTMYRVSSGDTLYGLSRILGVSVAQLQLANCLGNSTYIRTGQMLWVPYLPAPTPTQVVIPTLSPTLLPTGTPLPTFLPTVPPTATKPPAPTATPLPSHTPVPPTFTPVPPSETPVPAPTDTAAPIITDTPSVIIVPSDTPSGGG